jgi:hypothetical protein
MKCRTINERTLASRFEKQTFVTTNVKRIRSTKFPSVSIVSDYGLGDRAIEVRSPAEARASFLNLYVQTGAEAHPASCTMGTMGPLLGLKRCRDVTLIPHPILCRGHE